MRPHPTGFCASGSALRPVAGSGPTVRLTPVPLPNSPDSPQPLREVVRLTKDWVERLGAVWVQGQLIEIKRRAGSTQYLTLRDTVAEVSVKLSTSTLVLDAAGPLTEGTVVAAWVKPTVWMGSGQLTFQCRELRPSGEGLDVVPVEGDLGTAAWISCAGKLPWGQPDDQRSDDARSLVYDWEPLERELELLGHARVALVVTSSEPSSTLLSRT